MSYLDETSTKRLRQRTYERNTSVSRWFEQAPKVVNANSGSPNSYVYLFDEIRNRIAFEDLCLPSTQISATYNKSSNSIRKHIDQLCQWGLLEVTGKKGRNLVFSLCLPLP